MPPIAEPLRYDVYFGLSGASKRVLGVWGVWARGRGGEACVYSGEGRGGRWGGYVLGGEGGERGEGTC